MAHTFTDLLYHCVFSTKERRHLIDHDLLPELARVIGGIIRDRGGSLLECNAMPDHIHLLTLFPPTITISDMLRVIKSGSSGWARTRYGRTRPFAWQEGYSCFTVGIATREKTTNYIRGQQVRHKKETFEEELIRMLERAGIKYDPRFVFE